ncbi:MAG: IclR family transcriptional regulator [Thermanaerothrix sp.]|nr:IclR family transcriptional regulator [Thermanaerothrix sp.]
MSRLERGLAILNLLCEPPYFLSLSDVSRAMGMTKSGAYKILEVLVSEGLVTHEVESGLYRIGPVAYRMGVVYSNEMKINDAALPVMQKLGELTQETVSVGLRDGDAAFLALSVESPHIVRLRHKLGTRMPPNAGAIGKLLWAYHPDPARRDEILRGMDLLSAASGCPNPILDLGALLDEYRKIVKQGYAMSINESVEDFIGISVPIPDKIGRVWACLCVAAPMVRMSCAKALDLLPVLRAAAEDISARLG